MTVTDSRTRDLLRRLEFDVERRLTGLLQGQFRGLVSGLGSEPGEARGYQAGDDVRRMDWNVTARLAEPYVRDTIADRELETTAVVDLSPSLDFGTAVHRKADLALALVAAVGLLTDRTGNRLGAVVCDGANIVEHPARTGRRNRQLLLHRLMTHQVGTPSGNGLPQALQRLLSPTRRSGLAVVISDLLDPGWEEPLKAATSRHDTIVFELVDRRELTMPNVGVITLRDRTSGQLREINTGRRSVRERYRAAGIARLEANAERVRQAGAEHLVLRTDDDWALQLAKFIDRRKRQGHRRSLRSGVGAA